MKFEYLLLIKSNCKEKMQMNNNIQKEIIKFKQIDDQNSDTLSQIYAPKIK